MKSYLLLSMARLRTRSRRLLTEPLWSLRERRWESLRQGPPQLVTMRTANGLLTFDSRDSVIGRQLYVHRNWERDLLEHAIHVLRRGGHLDPAKRTVLDIGANIGMIATAMLLRKFFERAIAVEPSADNFRLLERNVSQNNLADRVVCLPIGLSSKAGELELELSAENFGDHRIRQSHQPGELGELARRTVKIPVDRLDSVLATDFRLDSASIGLVWMDVQGHEGHVFMGATELLRRGVPVICEFWPYGIERSNMSRERYVETVAEHFGYFYDLRQRDVRKRNIGELQTLFDEYMGPGGIAELLYVRE